MINGTKIAHDILSELKEKIATCKRPPGIALLLVGNDPASLAYVNMKKRRCEEIGFHSKILKFSTEIPESELLLEIEKQNNHTEIDGILVQLPLPSHIDPEKVVDALDPEKDVDCFHPINLGKMFRGDRSGFLPCTPLGVVELLKRSNIPTKGKRVVIVGRSLLVGKPLATLLSQKHPTGDATVTLAHSSSVDLPSICKEADILITAMGSPLAINDTMIKPGAVVIDVGVNRVENRLVGDVDFKKVSKIASAITPVPGGVGPMTIAMLLSNTYLAYTKHS